MGRRRKGRFGWALLGFLWVERVMVRKDVQYVQIYVYEANFVLCWVLSARRASEVSLISAHRIESDIGL